jgi:hypothetical protein
MHQQCCAVGSCVKRIRREGVVCRRAHPVPHSDCSSGPRMTPTVNMLVGAISLCTALAAGLPKALLTVYAV